MIRFAKVTRMVSNIVAEIKGIGGTTQNRMISLKGLYSKPKNENALVIPLSKGNNQDVILVLQKEKDLNDGDVYLTDDKSFIHFHFNGDSIELKTKDLVFNVDTFKVNATSVDFNTDSIKFNATTVDFDSDAFKVNADSMAFDSSSIKVNAETVGFDSDSIKVNADSVGFDSSSIKINADSVDFDGCSIKNNGTPIDDTHVHPQNAGNDFGGGVDSSPPK